MDVCYEIAQYRLNPGTTVSALQQALDPLHDWLVSQPGCLGVQSFLAEDGLAVTDLVAWSNRADSIRADESSQHMASLAALLPLVEPDSFRPSFGILVHARKP